MVSEGNLDGSFKTDSYVITQRPSSDIYDVIIIGSGPAGLSTAMRLAYNGIAKIAVIESGSLAPSASAQRLSEVTGASDLGMDYFAFHSQRTFGGTSSVWGGWCAVLERRAFELGEWPIDYEEIDRYYPEAAQILRVSADAYLYRESPIASCPGLVYKPFYLSNRVRFGVDYRAWIAEHPQIDLIVDQTCVRLEKAGTAITGVLLRNPMDPGYPPLRLMADLFVLACGGLGNPRLLQLSEIATNSPVGRNLMDHPHLYRAARIYLDKEKLQPVLSQHSQVVHALQLSTEYCLEQGLLSFSVAFDLDEIHHKPLLGKTRQLALTDVTIRAEMPPDPDNRITLGKETDRLGQARGHVHFHHNYDRIARHSWQVFSEQLLTSGLGRPASLPSELHINGGGHLMGTTRMGTSESESVVDGNCKVHTTANLFVAGSSVFPAGGAANPTFTIVALALRLGDHLSAVLWRAEDE